MNFSEAYFAGKFKYFVRDPLVRESTVFEFFNPLMWKLNTQHNFILLCQYYFYCLSIAVFTITTYNLAVYTGRIKRISHTECKILAILDWILTVKYYVPRTSKKILKQKLFFYKKSYLRILLKLVRVEFTSTCFIILKFIHIFSCSFARYILKTHMDPNMT